MYQDKYREANLTHFSSFFACPQSSPRLSLGAHSVPSLRACRGGRAAFSCLSLCRFFSPLLFLAPMHRPSPSGFGGVLCLPPSKVAPPRAVHIKKRGLSAPFAPLPLSPTLRLEILDSIDKGSSCRIVIQMPLCSTQPMMIIIINGMSFSQAMRSITATQPHTTSGRAERMPDGLACNVSSFSTSRENVIRRSITK